MLTFIAMCCVFGVGFMCGDAYRGSKAIDKFNEWDSKGFVNKKAINEYENWGMR